MMMGDNFASTVSVGVR